MEGTTDTGTAVVDSGSSGASGASSGQPSAPNTAAAALARAASAQESPAASGATGQVQTPGQGAPNAAATGQTGQPAIPDTQSGRGPVPLDRHEAAVRNAREQGRTEAREEVAKQFAWAKGMDPQQAARALALANRLDTDPRSFAAQLAKELGPQEDDSFPEADLVSNTGVKAFSDKAVLKALNLLEAKLTRKFEQTMAPVLSDREKAQRDAEVAEVAKQGRAVIQDALTHLSGMPHFKENEKAISEVMGAFPKATVDRVGIVAAMYMAYSQWMATALPTLTAAGVQKDRDDMRRQAASATGNVIPSGGQPAQGAKSPRNVSELASHMEKLATSMAG